MADAGGAGGEAARLELRLDYRDVIRELKKTQITGDAILPFYKTRLKADRGH